MCTTRHDKVALTLNFAGKSAVQGGFIFFTLIYDHFNKSH